MNFHACITTIQTKYIPKTRTQQKSTSFWLNVLEIVVLREKTVNKIEQNEPEKLNKLHKTDYAAVKQNKKQTNKNGDV